MLRITLIILLSQINFLYSQLSVDQQLLALEEEVYNSSSDTVATNFILEKLNVYIDNKLYGNDALREAKRIDYDNIIDSVNRVSFLWNAALLAHFNNETLYASHYINSYSKLSKDSSMQMFLLTALVNNGYDTMKVSESVNELILKNENFDSLLCINEVYAYEQKYKKRYRIASSIIPGLGSALSGKPGKGLVSFTLFGVTAYATVLMVQNNLYLSAILWGAHLTMKFYAGNKALTDQLVLDSENVKKNALAVDCKCIFDNSLNTYSINFK